MEALSEEFLAWAEDPSRSVEERYCIVRLTEYVYDSFYRAPDKVRMSFEEERQMREDRCYDAAYDPAPDAARLRLAAGLLPTLTRLELETHLTDRPIRDLGILAFAPRIQELKLRDIEIDRLDVLRHVPELRKIHIRTDEVEDYSDLALCRELREIKIQTWHPWPILAGLETLPHLEILDWLSNGRSLAGIPALPNLKTLRIDSPSHHSEFSNCVKDLHQLPDMPRLETLWGGWFHRLDGIERFPRLRIVCIKGYFKSLAPLAGLKEVTHLRVVSPRIQEVAAIAGMPSVFQFAIKSIRPQDWSPLFDSATLRDVYQDECEAPQPDFHTLRMLLPPQAEVFGSPEPRPHEPLRFRVKAKQGEEEAPFSAAFPEGPAGWNGCPAMRQSEIRWVENELFTALEEGGFLKLKGVRYEKDRFESYHMFSQEPSAHSIRSTSIRLLRTEAIGRLRSIVECMRAALLRTRYPWQIHFMLTPEADAEDWDETWRLDCSPEQHIKDLLEDEREAERARQRRRLFLKDEQRLQLLKELGHDPGEFRRSELPPEEEQPEVIIHTPSKDNGKDKKKGKNKNADDGGLAEADPDNPDEDESWLPTPEISDPNFEWNRLFLMFILTEDAVWIAGHEPESIAALSYLLDLAPEYPDGFTPETEAGEDL